MRNPECVAFTAIPFSNPYGPWTIPLSGGVDWARHEYTFFDLLLRGIPADMEKAGGTVSGVIRLLYRMPSVGLIATVSEPGIKIERMARAGSPQLPVTGVLSHVGVRRTDQARDLAIWLRRFQTEAASAKETEGGFSITLPKGKMPSFLVSALTGNDLACRVAFALLDQPESVPFKLTEDPAALRLDLLMDEAAKDKVWEKMMAAEKSRAPAATPAGETPADLLADIKKEATASRRSRLLKRLVVDLYEKGMETADRTSSVSGLVEVRLQSLAARVTEELTAPNRAQIERMRYSTYGSSSNTRERDRFVQENEEIKRQSRTNRKAFFEKVLSSISSGADRKVLETVALSRELAELAGTPLPTPASVVPAGPATQPAPGMAVFPRSVAICLPSHPEDVIVVVMINKDDAHERGPASR